MIRGFQRTEHLKLPLNCGPTQDPPQPGSPHLRSRQLPEEPQLRLFVDQWTKTTFIHSYQAKNWTTNHMLSEGTWLVEKELEEASAAAFCLLPGRGLFSSQLKMDTVQKTKA